MRIYTDSYRKEFQDRVFRSFRHGSAEVSETDLKSPNAEGRLEGEPAALAKGKVWRRFSSLRGKRDGAPGSNRLQEKVR